MNRGWRLAAALFVAWSGLAAEDAPVAKPPVTGYAAERVKERLDRGLIARTEADQRIYLSWRLLETDAAGVAFNVYRRAGETVEKVNSHPVRETTDLVDKTAPAGKLEYFVRPWLGGEEGEAVLEGVLVAQAGGEGGREAGGVGHGREQTDGVAEQGLVGQQDMGSPRS